jgi:hypothetical protein
MSLEILSVLQDAEERGRAGEWFNPNESTVNSQSASVP